MSEFRARPIRVLHIITRMIVGGAQENTMLSCALIDTQEFPSEIICGQETGVEGNLVPEARARGVPVHFEPSLVRAPNPAKDFLAASRIARFIERGRYDIVHTHTSKAGIVGRWAAELAHAPIVIHTAHGWGFNRRQSPLVHRFYVALERRFARRCDALIVVGETNRRDALALGIGTPSQYHLIRSGIEIERYRDVSVDRAEMRARLEIPSESIVIGTVGRIAAQKAPLELLAAFAPLATRRADAHLVFVGDGGLRVPLEAAVRAAQLESRVHVLGLRADVPELLRAFDVFALSSHWEGLPRVLPQAMAAGLPIVTTDVDGAREAVVDRETGFLVAIGDTAALGRRLSELAEDPAHARAMGARGRERVEEFSARRMVDQLADLYGRLAREKRLHANEPSAR
jgi:glycosyltransferase involved in cell wall biosynthesis